MKGFVLSGPPLEAELDYLPALVRTLTGMGVRVSVCLAAGSSADLDRPGKDSYRHCQAGAREVVLSSSYRWALLHQGSGSDAEARSALISRLSPADLVLLRQPDGGSAKPYLFLHAARNGWPGEASVPSSPIAIVGDLKDQEVEAPVFRWEELDSLAAFLIRGSGAAERDTANNTAL